MSDWNLWLDRLIALDLGVEETRLVHVLGRFLLGHRTREDRFGEDLLRATARLHGRSFERAREGLVAKGLLHFERGSVGGQRGLYRLLLDGDDASDGGDVNPAPERAFPPLNPAANPASKPAAKPALQRARIGDRGERREEEPARRRSANDAPHRHGTDDDRAALEELVEEINDSDEGTLDVLGKAYLGVLHAGYFDYVRDQLVDEWRDRDDDKAPRSEAALVFSVLRDLETGGNGDSLPPEYEL